jgi:hypothetical protein
VNLFWPHIIGGCGIARCTDKWLLEAGLWENVDLEQPEESVYASLPHSYGILTK